MVARLEVAQQQFVIDLAIASWFYQGDTQLRIACQAKPIVVSLDLAIALTVGQIVDLKYLRQQSIARVSGLNIGIDRMCEVIFVCLRVVLAR